MIKEALFTIVTLLTTLQAARPNTKTNPITDYGKTKATVSKKGYATSRKKILPVSRTSQQVLEQERLPWQDHTRTMVVSEGIVTVSRDRYVEVTEFFTGYRINVIDTTETFVEDETSTTLEFGTVFETAITETVQVEHTNTEYTTITDTSFESSTETVNEMAYVTTTDTTTVQTTSTNIVFEGFLQEVTVDVTETTPYDVYFSITPTETTTECSIETFWETPDLVTVTTTEYQEIVETDWFIVGPFPPDIVKLSLSTETITRETVASIKMDIFEGVTDFDRLAELVLDDLRVTAQVVQEVAKAENEDDGYENLTAAEARIEAAAYNNKKDDVAAEYEVQIEAAAEEDTKEGVLSVKATPAERGSN